MPECPECGMSYTSPLAAAECADMDRAEAARHCERTHAEPVMWPCEVCETLHTSQLAAIECAASDELEDRRTRQAVRHLTQHHPWT